MNVINKAKKLGKVIAGIFSEDVILRFDRFSILSFEKRMELFSSLDEIDLVVKQDEISYKANLIKYKPDYVVHGDNWKEGPLESIRQEVIETLSTWGGKLIEVPYTYTNEVELIEKKQRELLGLPENRRKRLKQMLSFKDTLNVIEVHNGLTGLIAEKTVVNSNNNIHQFDAMWLSSLSDSTAKGKPDIELVDMTSRIRTIEEIFEVTTKPMILDGDTGGLLEHFVYNIKTLERIGVSAVIIEDKMGLKRNSLFGNDVDQTQDTIENFSKKIVAGKLALRTSDTMIIARVESLILKKGLKDALDRAHRYVKSGADGIMIHSKEESPKEILDFCKEFRKIDKQTPLVAVPSTYNSITSKELSNAGVNIVIYANQLIRSSFPAMEQTAKSILKNDRTFEIENNLMSIKKIISLIE